MQAAKLRAPIARKKPSSAPFRTSCHARIGFPSVAYRRTSTARIAAAPQQVRYLAEDGGHVLVRVEKQSDAYRVETMYWNKGDEGDVQMHWGIYRSSPKEWIDIEGVAPEGSTVGKERGSKRTPMQRGEDGRWFATARIPEEMAPVMISFVLVRDGVFVSANGGKNFCAPVGIRRGFPEPLGVSIANSSSAENDTFAINFAVYSEKATGVKLCLARRGKDGKMLEVAFDPLLNRTGRIWHMTLEGLKNPHTLNYGYRMEGDLSWKRGGRFDVAAVLLDPYTKLVANEMWSRTSPTPVDEQIETMPLGPLAQVFDAHFDWESDHPPNLPLEELVIYEMNVAEFTSHQSSGLEEERLRGTFCGVVEKLDYLESLGVNAVLLEPLSARARGASLDDPPLAYFSPDATLAAVGKDGEIPSPHEVSNQLKYMIRELHKRNIEVILQMEFGRTAEGTDKSSRTMSMRGIDAQTYYLQGEDNGVIVLEGYGALNCNAPAVRQLIIDCLRHWVVHYHVDGFSFRHAEALTRSNPHGAPDPRPPLVEEIAFDPIVGGIKLFADPWNRLGLPEVGGRHLFPHWKRFAEFSPSFMSDAREFTRGSAGSTSRFAHALCGTADIFASGRKPAQCLNAIARYGGLTLADVVSYNHTGAHEPSWNNGVEGPAPDMELMAKRVSQVKMMLLVLFLSQGVPLVAMGDEAGHTRKGIPRLKERSAFRWETLGDGLAGKSGRDMYRFVSQAILFRKKHLQLLQPKEFTAEPAIHWHGADPSQPPSWEGDACAWPEAPESENLGSFLAFSILAPDEHDLYVAFNCTNHSVEAWPPLTTSPGSVWRRIADTSLPSPRDFLLEGETLQPGAAMHLAPNSAVILEASPAGNRH